MSIFGSVNMLGSALRNYQVGLNTVANNISNAATPGYSRQRAIFTSLSEIAEGRLTMGTGARVEQIQRLRDVFLDVQMRGEQSDLGRADARLTWLSEISVLFPEIANPAATTGIKGRIDNLATMWTSLIASPTSLVAKGNVKEALRSMAQQFNATARALYGLQVNLDQQITQTLSTVNGLLNRIATLNKQVTLYRAAAQGSDPNTTLDARESAAQELAKLIDVKFKTVADGTLRVYFSGGTLVENDKVFGLKAIPSVLDPGRTAIGYWDSPTAVVTDVTASVRGGSLGGLLAVRDIDLQDARLRLDKIAFGFIQRSNEINHSYVAADFSSGHNLFTGTKASDMALNTVIDANVDYIGGTRDAAAPGDLAKMQAVLKDFVMYSTVMTAPFSSLQAAGTINPALALNAPSNIFSIPPSAGAGELIITTGGNAVSIFWNSTQSLNTIINTINTNSGGAFYATFDQVNQKVMIFGQTPLTVVDRTLNLGKVLQLSAVLTSSAPINNSPVSDLNPVDDFLPLSSVQNQLDLFTKPSSSGTVMVDGATTFNWNYSQDISTGILLSLNGASAVNRKIDYFFDPVAQIVYLVRSGDPAFNPGGLTFANPMTSITVSDTAGNLTRALNLDTNTNSSQLFDQLTTQLSAEAQTETVLKQQSQDLVNATQVLQDQTAQVNLDEELALARVLQRSYEAAARLQFILDEMLNVLINRTGSSSSGSSLGG